MSIVVEHIKCPQCEYGQADHQLNRRSKEFLIFCVRCGYFECMERKRDDNGYYCAWEHEINHGAGALRYCLVGHPIAGGKFLHTRTDVAKAEQWLRVYVQKGQLDPAESYLTRWNDETKQVETVIGKFIDPMSTAGGEPNTA